MPDEVWDCEHKMTAEQHVDAGIPMWKVLDCLYHGMELKDGGTFDESTGKEVSNRVADRIAAFLGDEAASTAAEETTDGA